MKQARWGIALLISCGGASALETIPPVEAEAGVLLDTEGTLGEGDMQIGAAYSDSYEFPARAGEALAVEVNAVDFDPVLEVVPPGEGALVSDDWEGDRRRSRVELVAATDGTVKVRVTSYGRDESGTYRLRVVRSAEVVEESPTTAIATRGPTVAAVLASGQTVSGALEEGDPTTGDGRTVDVLFVDVASGSPQRLSVTGQGLEVRVVDPEGRALRAEGGRAELRQEGHYRVQLIAPAGARIPYEANLAAATGGAAAPQLDRDHHLPPTGGPATAVQVGQRVNARLEDSDVALPSGERADVYSFEGRAGGTVSVEMASPDLDSYLLMVGPGGEFWENDDARELDSRLDVTLPTAGVYRVVATTYRPDMRGAYELKVFDPSRTVAAAATPSSQGGSLRGTLAAGDRQLQSGEYADDHTFELAAGARVRFEARSTDFDTYLIVHTPSGRQHDNDDAAPGNTDAAVDLVAEQAGTYRVSVTSYRPGETGGYELISGNAAATGAPPSTPTNATPTNTPTPAVASGDQRGSLADGDDRLNSGEFVDRYTMRFETGRPVSLRLESTALDPYLIVVSPSGHQLDNDDYGAGSTNAGVDIPSAEAGDYVVMATSYQPGETGAYVLRTGAATTHPARPTNPTNPTNPVAANPGSGRVFGIFTGISDYPGPGDLPECANDAIKLAQTLRESGLMPASHQVVLTDAQVTTTAVREAFAQMGQRVGANDTFIFFYSGHGNQRAGSQDPREIDGTDETIVLYDRELSDDEMATLFDGIHGLGVLTLDSCFAGGFAKDVITRPGRMGLFSSEEDVLSSVAGQFQAGGYLSHFLRTGIGGEADLAPRDGALTAGELQHYLVSQFGTHVRDVRLNGAWQHLVVDRGAVRSDAVVFRY